MLAAVELVADRASKRPFPRALAMAEPGDLLVIFADDPAAAWKQVIYFGRDRE